MTMETMIENAMNKVKSLSPNDILRYVGLQLANSGSHSRLPMIAAFGTGVVVGVASGLLLAPQTGAETRRQVAGWFQSMWSSLPWTSGSTKVDVKGAESGGKRKGGNGQRREHEHLDEEQPLHT